VSCYHQASEVIRSAGYRLTPQRLFILEAVYHLGGHVTAEQVLAYVQKSSPYVDLSTVYRTLELLVSLGLIRRFSAPNRPNEYEVATAEPHHHLVCLRCGRVEAVPAEPLSTVLREIVAAHGFTPDETHLAIHGLCAECHAQERSHEA